jgi:hypothetical protein
MTDAEILSLAAAHQQYLGSKEVTLRGIGVIEFARALLRAALDGQEKANYPTRQDCIDKFTPTGTHGAAAAP